MLEEGRIANRASRNDPKHFEHLFRVLNLNEPIVRARLALVNTAIYVCKQVFSGFAHSGSFTSTSLRDSTTRPSSYIKLIYQSMLFDDSLIESGYRLVLCMILHYIGFMLSPYFIVRFSDGIGAYKVICISGINSNNSNTNQFTFFGNDLYSC